MRSLDLFQQIGHFNGDAGSVAALGFGARPSLGFVLDGQDGIRDRDAMRSSFNAGAEPPDTTRVPAESASVLCNPSPPVPAVVIVPLTVNGAVGEEGTAAMKAMDAICLDIAAAFWLRVSVVSRVQPSTLPSVQP